MIDIVPPKFREFAAEARDVFLEPFGTDFIGRLGDAVTPGFEALSGRARAVAERRLAEQRQAQEELAQGRQEITVPGVDVTGTAGQQQFDKILEGLQQQATLLRLNTVERERANEALRIEGQLKRELTPVERERLNLALEEVRLLTIQSQLLEEIQGPGQALLERQQALNVLLAEGRITLEEFNEKFNELRVQQLELQEGFGAGLELGIRNFVDSIGSVSENVAEVVSSGFGRARDAIIEFAQTGKFNIREFTSAILGDIARLAANQAFKFLIQGLLGGTPGSGIFGALTGGGAGGGIGGLLGFQQGGLARVTGSGGPDSQRVSFDATPGEMVAVSPPGRSPMMQTVVAPPAQVQVVNVQDPSEIPSGIETPEGEQAVVNVITRNPESIRRLIS